MWVILCVLVIYGGQAFSSVMPDSDELPSVDLSNFEALGVGKHSPLLKFMERQHFEQHSKLNSLISHVVQNELRLEKYIADKFASQDVMFTQRINNLEESILNRIGSMMDSRDRSFNDAVKLSQSSIELALQNMKDIIVQNSRELQKSFETMTSSLEESLGKWSGKDLKMSSVMERTTSPRPQQRPDGSDQIHEGSGDADDGAQPIGSEVTKEHVVEPKVSHLWENLQWTEYEDYGGSSWEYSEQNKHISSGLTGPNENWSLNPVKSDVEAESIFRSCSEAPMNKSGPYRLQPFEGEEPFEGYCEQSRFEGGWLVFQYRFNGSVDFYRTWDDYKAGFGNVAGEFWLGLERLHRLTSAKRHILMVELKTFDEEYGFAKYDRFEIGSEEENYALKELGSYRGTAGDSLTLHKGMNFTTKDRDNDIKSWDNCALEYSGAWWYEKCHQSNLNGPYVNKYTEASNCWVDMTHYSYHGLKISRMMVKEA